MALAGCKPKPAPRPERPLHASIAPAMTAVRVAPAQRLAGELHAQLHYGRVERIIEGGMHEYLTDFVDNVQALTNDLTRNFLAPVYDINAVRAKAA